jgi:hypothetical protein
VQYEDILTNISIQHSKHSRHHTTIPPTHTTNQPTNQPNKQTINELASHIMQQIQMDNNNNNTRRRT